MENFISRPEHEEFVKRMEGEHARQNKRIELLEDNVRQLGALTASIQKMAYSMESMAKEQENMAREQKEQGSRLEALENVPIKNLNSIKSSVLSAIGGAVGMGIVALLVYFVTTFM